MNKPEYDKNKAESFLKNIKGQSQNFEVLKPSALDLQSVHQEQDLDKLLEKGHELYSKNLFDDALFVYETALKKDPENPEIKLHIVKLYFNTEQQYLSCLKHLNDVIKYSRENENSPYEDNFLQNQLGYTYFCLGYYDKCRQVYETLLEQGFQRAAIYSQLIYIYFEYENDLDTALSFCLKACEFEPDNAYVNFMTGCVLTAREQFDDALKYILRAEELGYTEVEVYCKLSWLYLNFEDNDKAYFYAKKAVEKDENDGEAWMSLGFSLYSTNNIEKVFEAFEKAIDLGYEDNFMIASSAICLCDLGDLKSAQTYANKGLALFKDDPICLISQGIVLTKKGDYKKALKHLDKAYKLDNTLYTALFYKGYVYINMNKYKKALETILSIPEQERTAPEITLNISICFFKLKNYTQAETYLKKALDSEINDPEIFEFAAYYLYFYKKDKKLGAAYARKALEVENTRNPDDILQIARMIVKKENGKKVSLNSLKGSYEKDKKDIAWVSGEWGWLVFYYLKLVFFSVVVWYMVCRLFLLILPTT